MFKRLWLKTKKKTKEVWRWIVGGIIVAGAGSAIYIGAPVENHPVFDSLLGCVKNVNGDWVSFNAFTGKHLSKIKDKDGNILTDIPTSTSKLTQKFSVSDFYVGKLKDAPCVKLGDDFQMVYHPIKYAAKQYVKRLVNSAWAALDFPTSEKVLLGDNFDLVQGDSFTIQYWVLIGSNVAGDNSVVEFIGKALTTGDNNGWATPLQAGTNKMHWIFGISQVGGSRILCTTSNAFTLPTPWMNIAITHDNTTTCTGVVIYRDGVSQSFTQDDTGAGDASNTADFRIGVCDCSMDEVRIWGRILTASEILANMWFRIPDQENLKGYWRLDEGVGTRVFSYSSHPSSTNISVASTTGTWVDSAPINYPE